jgi:outer membrane receptor for ferric coprogen and ferric-rhodotorulic acid
MVYTSYTTATKAGGSNPNETAILDPYKPEDVAYFELGTKGLWMDGRLLANLTYFNGEHSDMIISAITDASSRNVNFDAVNEGFEGEFILSTFANSQD